MSEGNAPDSDVQTSWTDIGSAPAIDPNALDMDHAFDVLDHPRRRYVLYALANGEDSTLRELALKIATWEGDIDESAVDDRTHDRVYLSLYHAHVPKLEDEGVVEFDRSAETLQPGPHAEQVLAVLENAGGGG